MNTPFFKWGNYEKTFILLDAGDAYVLVDKDHPLWPEVSVSPSVLPYDGTTPAEVALADFRANAVCSNLQARVVLHRIGKLAQVEALVNSLGGEIKLAWDHASEFRRLSPNIIALAQHPSVGMTDEQLDDLFGVAQTISF